MGKNKLERFAYLHQCPLVYQNFNPLIPVLIHENTEVGNMKGQWKSNNFNNNNPIVLELACGGGEYTVALANAHPQKNFIGVDIKGARIWKGANISMSKGLSNVAFLRTRIEQLSNFFDRDEVDEIWITFPDPFLRGSKENKRLTSDRFLDIYTHLLKPKGVIHLKTDDETLYQFTLDTIAQRAGASLVYANDDIYANPLAYVALQYKTYYELEHLSKGRKIKYIQFTI
ncbi:MAG: tRNA (guanosine(46)-N7)-methyltransferase TrmB [Saprospiraceae bacterium]|nr:tRNA (guanosine(46)-N7)-methyltransferase TrmB [Saprospiraceae bacterium]MCB9309269.1 tRNA (guanosine(46)-N7)-methyltransferase TrmB [Lewinellaceae bacterium]